MEEDIQPQCDRFRKDIKSIGDGIRSLMDHGVFEDEESRKGQYGEMKANIMLAYRHMEDARMRVGKILQAAGDGVSILDK